VAWLDLTLNKGNYGGPVIKIGRTPDENRVIGIATFILNPFAQYAEAVIRHLQNPQNVQINISLN
jgi:serine protease Do